MLIAMYNATVDLALHLFPNEKHNVLIISIVFEFKHRFDVHKKFIYLYSPYQDLLSGP